MAGLTGWHLLILIAVVVLLFGAKRLPEMARALGQSARIFQREIKNTAATEHTHTQHPAPLVPPALRQPTPAHLPTPPDHATPPPTPTCDPTEAPTQ
jgi:sec-independent protein translocase protein TatA